MRNTRRKELHIGIKDNLLKRISLRCGGVGGEAAKGEDGTGITTELCTCTQGFADLCSRFLFVLAGRPLKCGPTRESVYWRKL